MPKFREKTAPVEARQFIGRNDREILDWVAPNGYDPEDTRPTILILTLEGELQVEVGDWVVQTNGKFSVVKPDEFKERYEAIHG